MTRAILWLTLFYFLWQTFLYCAGKTALFKMVAFIIALWFPLKALVIFESGTDPGLGFCFYPGMDPEPFTKRVSGLEFKNIAKYGIKSVFGGLTLLYMASAVFNSFPHIAAIIGMISFSLIIHFGLFNLLTAYWRSVGVDVSPIFSSPWQAKTLKEFWGKRWNHAFSEMTFLIIYKPFGNWIGRSSALFAAFLFSGLLHEIAISLPVGAGFGGPLLYFAFQFLMVYLEERYKINPAVCVLLPLPLLFHPWFIQGIIWPLFG